MSDVVIKAENLSKSYMIGHQSKERYVALRDVLANKAKEWWSKIRNPQYHSHQDLEEFWALKDVSFDVKRGETLGIIGRNGAGKTTLLKILSRITEPTQGRVTIKGRIASLLEVGTGFHPELTGRENIFLNGAILGMTRAEIKKKFDEIVDFAEVEKFLDTPVKRYSSGMYVRLAFAVAAHLEPKILIVDEVLAVGDAQFQKKCLGKMEKVGKEGRTVLFVSHNMSAIQSLCSSTHLLSGGKLLLTGDTNLVINRYLEDVRTISLQELRNRPDRVGNGQFIFTDIWFEDASGKRMQELISGKDTIIVLRYEARSPVRNVVVSIGFYGSFGQFLLMCNNEMSGQRFEVLPSFGLVKCSLPRLPFSQGMYHINLHCEVNGLIADWVQEAATVNVADGDFYGTGKTSPVSHGGFLVSQTWSYTSWT